MNQITFTDAISTLDTQKEGIPWDAIRFLYSLPPSAELKEKIIYALTHAYDDSNVSMLMPGRPKTKIGRNDPCPCGTIKEGEI